MGGKAWQAGSWGQDTVLAGTFWLFIRYMYVNWFQLFSFSFLQQNLWKFLRNRWLFNDFKAIDHWWFCKSKTFPFPFPIPFFKFVVITIMKRRRQSSSSVRTPRSYWLSMKRDRDRCCHELKKMKMEVLPHRLDLSLTKSLNRDEDKKEGYKITNNGLPIIFLSWVHFI